MRQECHTPMRERACISVWTIAYRPRAVSKRCRYALRPRRAPTMQAPAAPDGMMPNVDRFTRCGSLGMNGEKQKACLYSCGPYSLVAANTPTPVHFSWWLRRPRCEWLLPMRQQRFHAPSSRMAAAQVAPMPQQDASSGSTATSEAGSSGLNKTLEGYTILLPYHACPVCGPYCLMTFTQDQPFHSQYSEGAPTRSGLRNRRPSNKHERSACPPPSEV